MTTIVRGLNYQSRSKAYRVAQLILLIILLTPIFITLNSKEDVQPWKTLMLPVGIISTPIVNAVSNWYQSLDMGCVEEDSSGFKEINSENYFLSCKDGLPKSTHGIIVIFSFWVVYIVIFVIGTKIYKKLQDNKKKQAQKLTRTTYGKNKA
jgi:hypothetical protein